MCSTLDLVTLAFAATGVAPASFQDKTLVVWAAPANLTQRGGSVLTLEDPRDHFDAIVFGELRPACWMAGSDSFLRTQKDQANYVAETVGTDALVQMAIVYRGKQVAVYRSGSLYAQHTIAAPQSFGVELGAQPVDPLARSHKASLGDHRPSARRPAVRRS